MNQEPLRYLSYLLRLWQVPSQGQVVWRATLESPLTGKVTGFPDLESLFAYLEQQAEICLSFRTGGNNVVTEVNDEKNEYLSDDSIGNGGCTAAGHKGEPRPGDD